jgi:hypothetical protein
MDRTDEMQGIVGFIPGVEFLLPSTVAKVINHTSSRYFFLNFGQHQFEVRHNQQLHLYIVLSPGLPLILQITKTETFAR